MTHSLSLITYNNTYKNHAEYTKTEALLTESRKKNSPWSIAYYLHRGFSEASGKEQIEILRRNRSTPTTKPSDAEHWISKGYSPSDAITRAAQYLLDIGKVPTLESCINKFGESAGKKHWEQYQCNIGRRQQTELDNLLKDGHSINEARIVQSLKKGKLRKRIKAWESFDQYRSAVNYITHLTLTGFNYKINGVGRQQNEDIDHQFSCYGGWVNKISPFVIASIYNLVWLDHSENVSKGQYCTISKELLLEKYNTNDKNELRVGAVWEKVIEIINEDD